MTAEPTPSLAAAAMASLGDLDLASATRSMIDRLAREPSQAEALLPLVSGWMGRKDGAGALAVALEGKSIDASAARQLKSAVRKMNAPADLLTAIDSAGKLQENRWLLDETLRDRWLERAKTHGDAARGEWVYRRAELQCAQCHRIGGVGGLVGPDLTSIGVQAPADYLLEALLNPAAKVKEGYNAKVVRTEDDEVLAGIPIRESDDEVVLRLADNREVALLKSDIVDIKDSRSLMPDGLMDSLTEDEAIDLLRFIVELGKIDGSMLVQPDGSIRAWESLAWTEKAFVLFNRTSLDAVAGDQAAFTWQPHHALVSGGVPMRSLPTFQPHPGTPNITFLRTKIACSREGSVMLDLSGAPKGALTLWANGKPVPIEGNQVSVNVAEGDSYWFIGINRDLVREDAIRIRIDATRSTAKLAP